MSLFFSSHSFLMVHIMQEVLLCQRKNIIIPKKEVAFALIWDIIKKGRAFALIWDTSKGLCWVFVHGDGDNPISMEGVPDLRDHNSKYEIFKTHKRVKQHVFMFHPTHESLWLGLFWTFLTMSGSGSRFHLLTSRADTDKKLYSGYCDSVTSTPQSLVQKKRVHRNVMSRLGKCFPLFGQNSYSKYKMKEDKMK